jgi:excisionase family DNA binding protein
MIFKTEEEVSVPPNEKKLITVDDAARLLSIPRRNVQKLLRIKAIESIKVEGYRGRLIRPIWLDEYIQKLEASL